jgi:hypothetical protein
MTSGVIYGVESNDDCEKGVNGVKPHVGVLSVGTQVELLAAGKCVDMAYVRVLTGSLKGKVGCISASALTSQKQ